MTIRSILVLGLGEIGKPLLDLIRQSYDAVGVDIDPIDIPGECEIMHVCYPFEIDDFIGQTITYIEKYRPKLTIIESTVSPGTTRAIYEATRAPIVHSPVRGKHRKMREEMLKYVKFVGGIEDEWSLKASNHFRTLGMSTKILASSEATELAKLTETTYFSLLVAWAQEVERYCDALSVEYDEIVSFHDEISYLPPVRFFPGVIGGHCLMPNIKILKNVENSKILNAIEHSNEQKTARERE